ncbi:tumor protein p53-inducible nuclear protein 1 isoform X2 [Dunckerocampus dactyliophorus]|uniref:tumor protein p53-inducible nuclear protein 1 isoform X2 n=1 Tax=Dunckerocampus dactyliophorus TaxID=161453 RepID=UPI002404B79C|nr:tumor protein p53-inducible nuclear protein 1 isoform X2 [Dunckerocampus dactyliophorus]
MSLKTAERRLLLPLDGKDWVAVTMIGKILSQLLGGSGGDYETSGDTLEELLESEEGGWVVVNLPDNGPLLAPEADSLENLLIEHPSMSVYQMRRRMSGTKEEEDGSDDDNSPRSAAVRRHISWRLAAWGILLPVDVRLMAPQRAWGAAERKRLSRSALARQNLVKTRFLASERRYGHFKQPSQRLYNY